ncbi:hypothetical protein C8J57DRAFT_1187596, partial [Mycena rebaudengoi]
MRFDDLPLELRIEIFLTFVLGPDTRLISPSAKSGPLLLSQISRGWRVIALATQELWSSLSINAKTSHLELIRLWIARSGVQPLRFSINCAHLSGAACKCLLEVFLAHRNRWAVAHIELGSNKFAIRDVDTPLLEELHLTRYGGYRDGCEVILTFAPRLHELFWAVDCSPRTAQIPWSQLTHMYFGIHAPWQDVFHILQNCPLLEICCFADTGLEAEDGEVPKIPLILLPHLVTLTLKSLEPSALLDFVLDCLISPKLEELDICIEFGGRWPLNAVTSLFSRSRCPLKTLTLERVTVNNVDDFAECLWGVSNSLEDLRIYG